MDYATAKAYYELKSRGVEFLDETNEIEIYRKKHCKPRNRKFKRITVKQSPERPSLKEDCTEYVFEINISE